MEDDQGEILRLMHRYAELIDDGRLGEFAALFDDAVLRFEGLGEWHGAQEVLAFLERAVMLYGGTPRTSHVVTNAVVDVGPNGTATASCYVTVFQGVGDMALRPIVAGRYRDRFEHRDGTWRFSERIATALTRPDVSRHLRLDQV